MVGSPCISSFVIRIIKETDPQLAGSPYRGIIQHVQSDQELSFKKWTEVEEFIQRFVPIHQMEPFWEASCDQADIDEIRNTVQS